MNSSILSLVLLLLAVSAHAGARPAFTDCLSDVIYAANSTYEANLRRLAAVLPVTVSASQSSYTYRAVGFWPNRLRAISLCRQPDDDNGLYSCAACIAGAFRELERICPYRKEAFFSNRNCTLQLSEVRMLGTDAIYGEFFILDV
ncbi:hypothetical protein PR202_gb21084 [Eleusine coracana subsp. coracana]|uniref:Gnk2-homologous domain-containing protein n=1 Tax=Eleusine coracana subsp. coracana TaxID=191504 RepID=A0AAV5FCC7_ELECO|nr:hypothetical protein PR202_gb21084 [Eleusine coracana subsp. coracana]